MRIIECKQRSEEWVKARCGIPTASSFDKIVTSKGEPSKQRNGYLYQLAAERLSGTHEESYTSAAMEQGIEREEQARWIYAMYREIVVDEGKFCLSDDGQYGCSPDGLVGSDGLVELKCPIGKTQVEYLLAGVLPTAYFQQVQGQLLITGCQWCDFVSYYPSLPRFEVRIEPDHAFLQKLRTALDEFCSELDAITHCIEQKL